MNETFARAELFVVLLAAMLGLTALARKLLVPYPILLVLGGLALAFIPGAPEVQLEPDLVFVVFLPPILWGAAYFTSLRDFKRNLRSISGLAIGLVLLTTLVVGWVAHTIIPGMSWAVALCLGAIVSPPDAVAATAVMSRIGVPRSVISVLEGESLVNDASALVLYRAAVMAIVSGTFSLGATVGRLLPGGRPSGVLVGLAVGWLTRWAVRHMTESYSQIALTLLGAVRRVDRRRAAAQFGRARVRGGRALRAAALQCRGGAGGAAAGPHGVGTAHLPAQRHHLHHDRPAARAAAPHARPTAAWARCCGGASSSRSPPSSCACCGCRWARGWCASTGSTAR